MLDSSFETTLGLLETYGIAVLFCVFVLEGALVGKLIPTRTVFVAAILAVGSDVVAFLPVAAAAVVGATAGQCLLFVFVRRFGVDPTRIRVVPVADDGVDGPLRWLDRWGVPAVAVTNALPGTRSWIAVPTANSSVSTARFAAASQAVDRPRTRARW
jgi:Uncharacterized membrane-associated protein